MVKVCSRAPASSLCHRGAVTRTTFVAARSDHARSHLDRTSPHPLPGRRGPRGCRRQPQRQRHFRRHRRGPVRPARSPARAPRGRRHRGGGDAAGAGGGCRRTGHGLALPIQGDRRGLGRAPLRGGGPRRRRADPLGRSCPARRAGLRPTRPVGGGAGPAIRLQQRLRRLLPDARGRRSGRPRPPGRQPRVHQRGADVPRSRPPGHQERGPQGHDRRPRRDRDGGSWRHGDRDPQGRRQVGGGEGLTLCPPHHRDDADGDHRPGRGLGAPEDQGRSGRPLCARHDQQLCWRNNTLGDVAHLRREHQLLLLGQACGRFAGGQEPQAHRHPRQRLCLGPLRSALRRRS